MMFMMMVMTKMMIMVPNLEKKKEKNKMHEIKAKVLIEFCFCQSRHHRGCDIGFRIDSRTVKRGDLIVTMVI